MRLFPAAVFIAATVLCVTLHAGILPTVHLDPSALGTFENYVTQFKRNVAAPYTESGKMWIDTLSRNGAFAAGKPVLEARENTDIAGGGSIHHFSGAMHLAGRDIADIRHVLQDYANYPGYFRPDVSKGSGEMFPDSSPQDEHYTSRLTLIQSTLWIAVSYDCVYDTHYRSIDPHHWWSESSSVSIKEYRDPKDVTRGYYPEGDDHGFLWRTNTFWFARDSGNGVDVEIDSMTLSRTVPTGFAWWGTKRTHDAVEKILKDVKAAVDALHQPHT